MQFIKETLYHALRDFGVPVAIVKLLNSEVDVLTGLKNESTERLVIQRVGRLPTVLDRRQWGKSVVDASSIDWIVSHADAPGIVFTCSDWLEFDNRRYQILSVEDFYGIGSILNTMGVGAESLPINETLETEISLGGSTDTN